VGEDDMNLSQIAGFTSINLIDNDTQLYLTCEN
jgi:hypothetical protein